MLGYEEVVKRDLREMSWGLAKAGTMPKVDIIINEKSIDDLFQEFDKKIMPNIRHA